MTVRSCPVCLLLVRIVHTMEEESDAGAIFRQTQNGGDLLARAIEAIFECRRRSRLAEDVSHVRMAGEAALRSHEGKAHPFE